MSIVQARQLADISAPTAVIGVLGDAVVGGLAAVVGRPVGWALAGAVALAVPLAVIGAVYERITPGRMIHIKDHNPYAQRVYDRYVAHAEAVWAAREHKRARRAASTGAAARGRARRST